MLLDHRVFSLSFRDLLSTNRMGWGEESLPERPRVDLYSPWTTSLTTLRSSCHCWLLQPPAHSPCSSLLCNPSWVVPQVYFILRVYVCVHSFSIKQEENIMRERSSKDISVKSMGDRKSNVSFPEVSTRRGRCCFEENKPNSVLMAGLFSLVQAAWQNRPAVPPC